MYTYIGKVKNNICFKYTSAQFQEKQLNKTRIESQLKWIGYWKYFIFTPTFPLGRVAGVASLGELEIPHGQHHSQIAILAPHQDRAKQDWKCNYSTWSLTSGPLSRGCSQWDLSHQSSVEHSGHMAEQK